MSDLAGELNSNNKVIEYSGIEIINVLQEIEFILCSLHNMGSYYSDKERTDYEKETTRFIDDSLICNRLAMIRAVLTKGFDSKPGEDEMDDTERAYVNIPVWQKPQENCTSLWLEQSND